MLWGEDRYSSWTVKAHTSVEDTGSRQRSSHCTPPTPHPLHTLPVATNTLRWFTLLAGEGFREPAGAAVLQLARPRECRYQSTQERLPSQICNQPQRPEPLLTSRACVRDLCEVLGGRQRELTWTKLSRSTVGVLPQFPQSDQPWGHLKQKVWKYQALSKFRVSWPRDIYPPPGGSWQML